MTQHVTIADLFSHRSGLPGHAGDSLQSLGCDRDYILSHLRLELLAAFRDSYACTNFGLTAAAVASATAAGTDWEDLSEQVLYRPLGMTSTSWRFADYAKAGNRALTHVEIHGKWVAKYTFDDDAASPASAAPAQPDSTYVGTYTNDYYGRLTVATGNGGGLVMQLGPKNLDADGLGTVTRGAGGSP